jgi:hypothetical protein
MEKAHYPFAHDNVERIREIIEQQQMAMEQAMMQQQQMAQMQPQYENIIGGNM